jgi:hypothetical protein
MTELVCDSGNANVDVNTVLAVISDESSHSVWFRSLLLGEVFVHMESGEGL